MGGIPPSPKIVVVSCWETIEVSQNRSVLTLMPYADFLATIDNSDSTPHLWYFAAIDRSGSWQRITARFAHTLPGAAQINMFTQDEDNASLSEGDGKLNSIL